MSNQKTYLVSPPGRIIQGDLVTVNKTDHQNRPLEERKWNRYFGLAIPKTDPTLGEFLGAVQQAALAGYQPHPHVAAQVQAGLGSNFAWKIEDGDAVDAAGQFIVKNDHARGCILIKFQTTLEINACDRNNQPIDAATVKRGYWADVSMSVSINGATDNTAGIYVNPNTVRFLGYDDEIQSGPSIEQQFSGRAAANVGSQTPVSPGGAPGGMMGNAGTVAQGGNGMNTNAGSVDHQAQQPAQGGMMAGTPAPGMAPQAGTPAPGASMPGMGGNPAVNPHHGIMDPGQQQQPPATNGYANGMMPS